MNFLGIGPAEILVVFVIMLVVAGPKRMIQWAYHLGRYTSQIRAMFQEAMDAFNKELNEAGLDVKDIKAGIPNLSAGAFNILEEADKVINSTPDYQAQQAASATPPPEPKNETPAEPTPGPETASTDETPDNERPKYDSWLPNS
jgi:Sec-independent protein translocase protein TatA